jgi:hypothetical protein
MMTIRAVLGAMLVVVAGACAAQKPNDWAFQNAMIGPDSPIEMKAGSTYQAQVVYPVPDGPLYPLKAKVAWRIEPAVNGIAIDSGSGKITVQAGVAHGTTALVHADVENGRRKLKTMLYVFRPETNPLIGSWSVDPKVACGEKQELNSPETTQKAIAGLDWKFHVDEQFWIGREQSIAARIQLDGKYKYDQKTRLLTLMPEWPKDKKNSVWAVSLQEDGMKLLLRPMQPEYGSETGCSYVLHRR